MSRSDWKRWQCIVCGWIYDEEFGSPEDGLAPGVRWAEVPEDWRCPECLATKSDFIMLEIARQASRPSVRQHQAGKDHGVVIVGSGLAAHRLVQEVRVLSDRPITIVTREDGAHYAKPILSTAFGKRLDSAAIVRQGPDELARQFDFKLLAGHDAIAIDRNSRRLQLGSGQTLPYSDLVIACGACAITPAIPGAQDDRCFTVDSLTSYERFSAALVGARSVAVVGAGLIGCEFADDLARAGLEVNCIEAADEVLPGLLPPQLGQAARSQLEDQGITFHLGARVIAVEWRGSGGRLRLSGRSDVSADLILFAVGVRSQTELARASGLVVNRGIVVDRFLRTSDSNIMALGDCAEVLGRVRCYVSPMHAGAKALASTLAGRPAEVEYGVMPVVVKTASLPIVVRTPPDGVKGQWAVDGTSCDLQALYLDAHGRAHGYALTGNRVNQRAGLNSVMPPELPPAYRLPHGRATPPHLYRPPRTLNERFQHWWLGA